jgi:hypothetical protein
MVTICDLCKIGAMCFLLSRTKPLNITYMSFVLQSVNEELTDESALFRMKWSPVPNMHRGDALS